MMHPETAMQLECPATLPTIHQMQFMQLEHDRTFHTDVFHLETKHKLYHYTAHMYKYISEVHVATHQKPGFDRNLYEKLEKYTNDMFIILMSMANLFHINLQSLYHCHILQGGIPNEASVDSSVDTFSLLTNCYIAQQGLDWVIQDGFITMGRVSKICEGLDHLESFDMKSEFNTILISLLACAALIRRFAIDRGRAVGINMLPVEVSICQRLHRVQNKNSFAIELRSKMLLSHHQFLNGAEL